MKDRSEFLHSLLRSIDLFEKSYALNFKALAELYDRIQNSHNPEVEFKYSNNAAPYRSPMPKVDALEMAPLMLAGALTLAAIKLYGALDHYLWSICHANYDGKGHTGTIDRTWWSLEMVEPILEVPTRFCIHYNEILILRDIWLHFFKHDVLPEIPPSMSVQNIKSDFQNVREFAIDLEEQAIIKNPNLRLD